jgi:mRNA-degrading endonuclease YafQ of YafQ-DinJ toxin-antitoxin module
MTEIAFSSSFERAYKKKFNANKELEDKFWEKIEKFKYNPFDPTLKTHKLSGELKDLFSFSVQYDVRVIFYFTHDNKAVFTNIGTHDEVY